MLLWLLHKTYSICDAPLSRSARRRESALLRHRNRATTTVLNLRVNRSPLPYDFRGSAKAIGYSVTVWPPKLNNKWPNGMIIIIIIITIQLLLSFMTISEKIPSVLFLSFYVI